MSDAERGHGRHSFTLGFASKELEGRYQAAAGSAGGPQLRLGLAVACLLWGVAAFLMPRFTPVGPTVALVAAGAMVVVNLAALALAARTPSLDGQQAIGTVVNGAAGIAVLWLSLAAGSAERHAAPALMLVSIFAFVVLRLRFVAALAAAILYLVAFASLAGILGPEAVAIHAFLLVSAIGSALAATYLIESADRDRFLQREQIAEQEAALRVEKAKSDRLLRNILPEAIVAELREEEHAIARGYDDATVLFADLVGFTPLVERMPPSETAAMLNELYSEFDEASRRHGVEKIKTIGDSYMAAAGVPEACADHAERMVLLALEMLELVHRRAGSELNLRIGIHSGPVVAGVIGRTKFSFDLWGDTVNVASRLESQGVPGSIQVSEATRARLGGRFPTRARGEIKLKGRAPMTAHLIESPPAQASTG